MYWVIAIVLLCLLVLMVWASADVGSNAYVRAHCRAATAEKKIALTFDDGPDEGATAAVLDILLRYRVRASFFLVGSKVRRAPELVRRILAEGHTVANHTYSHRALFPLSSGRAVRDELERCAEAIGEACGKRPRLFRPPFGVTNPIIGKVVRDMGLECIGWSVRSLDTLSAGMPGRVLGRVRRRLHPGAVVLLHDRCAVSLLEQLILDIFREGYEIVPLDTLFSIQAYEK